MYRCRCNNPCRRAGGPRRGLTLVELLIAAAVMSLIAATLGMLAMAVQSGADYSLNRGVATQHARVAVERIERTLNGAHANGQWPPFGVYSERVGTWDFPDTLVVWSPVGSPADPDGTPLRNELVIYCPDPTVPNRLIEIRPSSSAPVPALADGAAWTGFLAAEKASSTADRVTLTDLLRAMPATDAASTETSVRGALRFAVRMRPDDTQWAGYEAGTVAWDELLWPQDLFGSQTGVRQAWCRFELQLVAEAAPGNEAARQPMAFFGSAAVYYQMQR